MRRNFVTTALALCLLGMGVAGSVRAQSISIPIGIHHHLHGTIGTIGSGWLTILGPNHSLTQLLINPQYHPPAGLVAGKVVRATYFNNNMGQHILVSLREDTKADEPGTASSPSNVVNTLPTP